MKFIVPAIVLGIFLLDEEAEVPRNFILLVNWGLVEFRESNGSIHASSLRNQSWRFSLCEGWAEPKKSAKVVYAIKETLNEAHWKRILLDLPAPIMFTLKNLLKGCAWYFVSETSFTAQCCERDQNATPAQMEEWMERSLSRSIHESGAHEWPSGDRRSAQLCSSQTPAK